MKDANQTEVKSAPEDQSKAATWGKSFMKEMFGEMSNLEYREVPYETIVEVPQIETQVVTKEVDVSSRVELPIIQPRKVPVEQYIVRNIPKPVELRTRHHYEIPRLKPVYKEVPVPIYVPRYIEVPVPAQFVNSLQASMSVGEQGSQAGSTLVSRSVTMTSQTDGAKAAFTADASVKPDGSRRQSAMTSEQGKHSPARYTSEGAQQTLLAAS